MTTDLKQQADKNIENALFAIQELVKQYQEALKSGDENMIARARKDMSEVLSNHTKDLLKLQDDLIVNIIEKGREMYGV